MNINQSNEVSARITRVINELRMEKKSVSVFKVHELTGIDQHTIFMYFYSNGLLRGK